LTGVAVKVTGVPWHTGFAEGTMVTDTGRLGITLIVTVGDDAGLPVAQVALEISVQLTWSLLEGVRI
jgi:hypothetical protein